MLRRRTLTGHDGGKASFPIETKLAGVTFENAQDNIKLFGCDDIGTYALVREPDNPHDTNAIRVALFGHYYMGYIPKEIARQVALEMDKGKDLIAEFVRRNEGYKEGWIGLTVRIVENN